MADKDKEEKARAAAVITRDSEPLLNFKGGPVGIADEKHGRHEYSRSNADETLGDLLEGNNSFSINNNKIGKNDAEFNASVSAFINRTIENLRVEGVENPENVKLGELRTMDDGTIRFSRGVMERVLPQLAPRREDEQAEPTPAEANEQERIAPGKKNPREAAVVPTPAEPGLEARIPVVIVPEKQEEYYEKGLATVTMSELRDGKGAHDQLDGNKIMQDVGSEDVSFAESMKNIDSDDTSKITDITVLHQLIRAADEYSGEQGLTGDSVRLKEFLETGIENDGIKGHEDHLFITSAVSAKIQDAYYQTFDKANADGNISREEHAIMVNDAIKAAVGTEKLVEIDRFEQRDDISAPPSAENVAQKARNNEREV